MAGPFAERGSRFEGSQFGGSYNTPGFTLSLEVVNTAPVDASVHVGLAEVFFGWAIMGIAGFTSLCRGTVNFGVPETWETAIWVKKLTRLTIGFSVARGAAKGWWFAQFWG